MDEGVQRNTCRLLPSVHLSRKTVLVPTWQWLGSADWGWATLENGRSSELGVSESLEQISRKLYTRVFGRGSCHHILQRRCLLMWQKHHWSFPMDRILAIAGKCNIRPISYMLSNMSECISDGISEVADVSQLQAAQPSLWAYWSANGNIMYTTLMLSPYKARARSQCLHVVWLQSTWNSAATHTSLVWINLSILFYCTKMLWYPSSNCALYSPIPALSDVHEYKTHIQGWIKSSKTPVEHSLKRRSRSPFPLVAR